LPAAKLHKDFVKGKEYAFRTIYKDYSAMVLGIALRYTRCRDDAQDVLQETFIRAYEKRNTYQPKYPISPWLKKIAINAALQYVKRTYKLTLIEQEEHLNQIVEPETEYINIEELKQKLIKILNRLPNGYKVVFNLFVIDNLTHKEIANYLGVSESTSRTQLHKAKKMIAEILEKDKI
jgi:RNA polymerase sigma-70 factor (ECF subfamily)